MLKIGAVHSSGGRTGACFVIKLPKAASATATGVKLRVLVEEAPAGFKMVANGGSLGQYLTADLPKNNYWFDITMPFTNGNVSQTDRENVVFALWGGTPGETYTIYISSITEYTA